MAWSARITYDSNGNRKAYGVITYTIPRPRITADQGRLQHLHLYFDRQHERLVPALVDLQQGEPAGHGEALAPRGSLRLRCLRPAREARDSSGTPSAVDIYHLNGHLLTESSHAATVETDYAYMGGMPLAAIQPAAATISALHTDNIGTVQRATNAAKTIVWTGNYTPAAPVTPTTSITMNLRLLGQYADGTSYNHNGFRDLAPSVFPGYIQSDPLGIAPWLQSPSQGPNTYPSANGNPIINGLIG